MRRPGLHTKWPLLIPNLRCRGGSLSRRAISSRRSAEHSTVIFFPPPRFRCSVSALRHDPMEKRTKKATNTPETADRAPFSKSVQSSQLNIPFLKGVMYMAQISYWRAYVGQTSGSNQCPSLAALVGSPKKSMQVAPQASLRPWLGVAAAHGSAISERHCRCA